MRIRILSDLHIDVAGGRFLAESPAQFIQDCNEDLVVLAGDIAEGVEGLEWAVRAFPRQKIIIVLGNHEFYGHELNTYIDEYRETARALGRGRIHFLERDAIVIDGVRFIGTTLWTDYALYGAGRDEMEASMAAARAVMLDYRRVLIQPDHGPRRFLTPEDTIRLHRPARQFVTMLLASGDPNKTVIVTHHAPHRRSLAPQWAKDLTSAGFVSDLGRLMGRAALWIHGHTHTSFDYLANGTRVVCNPRGYCSRDGFRCENPEFRWDLTVDVG
jgi:predicted phosphodiesterase